MTIELTERDLYLIINALAFHKIRIEHRNKDLSVELDDLLQDLQFQSN